MKGTRKLVTVLLFAFAGTATGECTVNVTPTNFGIYYPTVPSESTGDVSINCLIGIPYRIKLDAGINSLGNYFPRMMSATSSILEYNLYTTSQHLAVWGDGTSGTLFIAGNGTGAPELLKIYGKIPANQNVADGVYTDAVNVLVEW